jgi:hypothetical protein
VYAFAQESRPVNMFDETGFASQYAVARESQVLPKPAHLAHEDAAPMPGYTVTAYQTVETALRLLRENGVQEGLEDKTIFGTYFTCLLIALLFCDYFFARGQTYETKKPKNYYLIKYRKLD